MREEDFRCPGFGSFQSQQWPEVQAFHLNGSSTTLLAQVQQQWWLRASNPPGVLNHESSPLPESRARNTAAPCQTLWIYAFPPQFNSGGPEEGPGQSECLHEHGEQQREVLGAPDGEFVCGVEVDDLWDGVKRRAVLSQDVLPVLQMGELHMHEALAAPVGEANRRTG